MLLLLEAAALVATFWGALIPAGRRVLANEYLAHQLSHTAWRVFYLEYWNYMVVLLLATHVFVGLVWLGGRLFGTFRRGIAYAFATLSASFGLLAATGVIAGKLLGATLVRERLETVHQVPVQLVTRFADLTSVLYLPLIQHPMQLVIMAFGPRYSPLVFGGVLVLGAVVAWLVCRPVLRALAGKAPLDRMGRRLRRTRPWWVLAALPVLTPAVLSILDSTTFVRPSTKLPNVILISIDTLRADHLTTYGYPAETSPSIDQFGTLGVVFERAVSQSNSTLPSHASMLTGLYPNEHGANRIQGAMLAPQFDTLAEILLERGYHTMAATSCIFVSRAYGFDQGFEEFFDRGSNASSQIKIAQAMIQSSPPGPYFLFLHLFDPHDPYEPRGPYRRMFLQPGEEEVDVSDGRIDTPLFKNGARGVNARVWDILHRLYDGEIRYVDDNLGEFFRWLAQRPDFQNTIIVVTSDHGESFGEHGVMSHGTALYTQQVHVPLLVVYPRRVPASVRRNDLVEASVSLVPTIMEMIGLPYHAPAGRASLFARKRPDGFMHSENALALLPQYALQDDEWKLTTVVVNGKPDRAATELFRTSEWIDQTNVAHEYQSVVDQMLGDPLERYLAFGRNQALPRGASVRLSPEDVRQLRSLGYLR